METVLYGLDTKSLKYPYMTEKVSTKHTVLVFSLQVFTLFYNISDLVTVHTQSYLTFHC